MRHKTPVTTLFIIAVMILFAACNNVKKNKAVTDISSEASATKDTTPIPPPYTDPSKVKVIEAEKKCFRSEGLKYTTTINISMGETECVGIVTSEEMGSGKKETARFSGSLSEKGIVVKFDSRPPVVGDASEWIDNIWTIKKTGKKEILTIPFNAKNYETSKWQLTDYQFEQVDCN